jgi:hypothetical protein
LKVTHSNRPNRAIFIISDEFDPNFYYTKDWKSNTLSDPTDSFGFLFICSSYLNDSGFTIASKMWSDFQNEVNLSQSFTRYIDRASLQIAESYTKICSLIS